MKLIVGLGNPGNEYINTRHNIGFMCIDSYASYKNVEITKKKFNGIFTIFFDGDEQIILLKPQSYINLSGEVIKKFIDYYKISLEDILIINDDLDLTIGKIKLKPSGSSGGHNGLKNIELHLATKQYKRLKIGISNDKNIDTKDYVLSKIDDITLKIYKRIFLTTNTIIDDFVSKKESFDKLMSKYNHK